MNDEGGGRFVSDRIALAQGEDEMEVHIGTQTIYKDTATSNSLFDGRTLRRS